jgi:GR25 family glycosyltransferase involved in LPS biosynthesis
MTAASKGTLKEVVRKAAWRMYMFKPIRALYVWAVRVVWLLHPSPRQQSITNKRYSIGVVTYVSRYTSHFKPLICQLTRLFPNTEIIVAINGYHDTRRQEAYLSKITKLLGRYPNVRVLPHEKPQSLSKLWNQLIITASAPTVLILNDDVLLLPTFRKHLERLSIESCDVILLKATWSHFFISKNVVAEAGWFDERFPGVGNEDEDYEARLTLLKKRIQTVPLAGLRNISAKTKDFSYGRNMEVVKEKYTGANKRFFDSKWELSDQPREGFTYVRILQGYVRMRPTMATPDFYPDIKYPNAQQ